MNDASSRSHAIFTVIVEQHLRRAPGPGEREYTSAKFHLVDLVRQPPRMSANRRGSPDSLLLYLTLSLQILLWRSREKRNLNERMALQLYSYLFDSLG